MAQAMIAADRAVAAHSAVHAAAGEFKAALLAAVEAGCRQRYLADRLGVPESTLSRWVTTDRLPKLGA